MTVKLYRGDLPADFSAGTSVAIDTETLGLKPARDKLCLVQISTGDGNAVLVQMDRTNYHAPNLKALLANPKVLKIFHFARFDVAVLKQYLDVDTAPLFCTKIASKLVRTYTDRHGLKELVRELLGLELSKAQQSSDWGADELSDAQKEYAASDVRYLHRMRDIFEVRLAREKRTALAQACFDFLPARAMIDLAGWDEVDIFAHV